MLAGRTRRTIVDGYPRSATPGNEKIRDEVGEYQDAEFISVAETARLLFVSRRHVVRLIEARRLHAY